MIGIVRHLLAATDGSENGDRVVSFAIAAARRYRCDLLLCHVVDHAKSIAECLTMQGAFDLPVPFEREQVRAAESMLAKAAKRARDVGIATTTVVLAGRPARAIVEFAKERQVDAMVIGAQGKRGLTQFFLGSTAEGVLSRTDIPTFVVPPGASDAERAFDRVLVAIDDSDPSDAAAAFALDLAEDDDAELVFCCVEDTNELVEKAATHGYDALSMLTELRATAVTLVGAHADRARTQNVAFRSVVAEGDPVEKILQTAEAQLAGLIVIGTHGRRGLRRLFVGSVAASIVRRCLVPVVVVRTSRFRSDNASETAMRRPQYATLAIRRLGSTRTMT